MTTHSVYLLLLAGLASGYCNWFIARYIINSYAAILRRRNRTHRARLLSLIGAVEDESTGGKKLIIGFLHPYCNAGGGGERVLWTAVAFHQRTQSESICAIYTGDLDVSKQDMIDKVKDRFGITLEPSSLLLIPLQTRYLVEASTWPRCTLLGQSLGSIVLGYEALSALIPDIYIDTMGYAFTFPVFRLLTDVPIGAYVHYPTISTDMLARVSRRSAAHNNSATISNSVILSYAKLIYYVVFAEMYSLCLRQAHLLMANSTWTKNHVDRLLVPWLYRGGEHEQEEEEDTSTSTHAPSPADEDGLRQRVPPTLADNAHVENDGVQALRRKKRKFVKATVVYPPCDVESFAEFPVSPRASTVLSISQFRPEKEQAMQIRAFARFVAGLETHDPRRALVRLVLAGSCRDRADRSRVDELLLLAQSLGVAHAVSFKVNISWDELKELLKTSLVGISTMVDEHFGISVVEFMAAGLIPLVHRSGGPLLDIVVPLEDDAGQGSSVATGFHADGVEEYAEKLALIFAGLGPPERAQIQQAARTLATRKFTVLNFERAWSQAFRAIVAKQSL
ncbi:hypothetical protein PCANC_20839 [Puccinia coronata f. sp. avenae]|uniref:GDP-Man:Man(3)GlcNAc(2)-PP-Dol alpha-1,2-mannosyltransferase n=1 Tax=Puccinia coronata f. sp. avenae TaxID=200324 RepID=A0A2N5S8H8_9BASI|nr:hypothetical protein PCANC_20839 [Puccinia coronata f. sp. avenae]